MTDSAQSPSSATAQRRSKILSHIRSGFTSGKSPVQQPPQQPTSPPKPQPRLQKPDLKILDRVISQVEQQASVASQQPPSQPAPQQPPSPQQQSPFSPAAAAAVPQAVAQATDTLNPTHPVATGKAKEHLETGGSVDQSSTDTEQSVGAAPVETEVSPEISPEVESYLEKVEEHQSKIPEEIVLADDGQTLSTKPHIAQPVIVLPITEQEEDEGAKKNPTFSFRWLVEWSRKLMKKFTGKVIYREE